MGGFERIREELVSLFEPAQEADVRADEFQPPESPAGWRKLQQRMGTLKSIEAPTSKYA